MTPVVEPAPVGTRPPSLPRSLEGRRAPCVLGLGLLLGGLLGACQGSLLSREEREGAQDRPRDFWGREPAPEGEGPEPPSFDPIVLPRPAGRGGDAAGAGVPGLPGADERERVEVEEADRGWREKLEVARALLASGEEEAAAQLVEAALSAGPPAAWAGRLRNLQTELRLRRAESTVLRIDARPVKDVLTFGEDVEFRLRLRNVSGGVLTFAAPRGGGGRPGGGEGSASAFTLEVLRRDRDVYGNAMERTWSRTVFLQPADGPALVLGPDQVRDLTVRVPAEDVGPALAGVRVIELSGLLRPAGLTLGDAPVTAPLRLRRGRALVLPGGFEPLAQDPLGALERALPVGAAPHLLVATAFVPRAEAPQAVALLARALVEGDPLLVRAAQGALTILRERCVGDLLAPLADLLLAALDARPDRAAELIGGLERLVEARLAPDARLWQDWWRRTRPLGPVLTPPGAPSTQAGAPSGGSR